jgi:hypothetical protein
MAERFMYTPSLGFCIILTWFLIRVTKAESIRNKFKDLYQFFALNQRLFFIVLGITALYCLKTISRNPDWKDNLTIFSHDVKISGNSARANQILGSALMISVMKSADVKSQEDTFRLAKGYLKRALEIYPEYYAPFSHLGVIYLYEKKFLHAKHMTFDDDIAWIGSSNLDIRSFELNAEINVLFYDATVVDRIKHVHAKYLRYCESLELAAWQERPFLALNTASAARVGPTSYCSFTSSAISRGLLRMFDRLIASRSVMLPPEIWAESLLISSLTVGAE